MDIQLNISTTDQKILEDEILDIEEWVQGMLQGKINKVKQRLAQRTITELKADPAVASMPANEDAIVQIGLQRPGYKNRRIREQEERGNRHA